ncbi:MAG: UMP kinase [Planctomycetota bacterium]|nr:uridine monophosphate kinase [Planctomycetota bacterium]MCX8039721.1 uridine monophosphate kinase [Planctomycetota bacterium]MDW8373253.1 UMP kinase [Planctomycetota bacterium]
MPLRLLKLSGEVLAGGGPEIHDPAILERVGRELLAGAAQGPVAVVVGGGNIIRGAAHRAAADPTRGDRQGMLATLINALALQDAIERLGGRAAVHGPYGIPNVCTPFERALALAQLAEGVIVICGGGTGHPFFTTDTAAALRAAELGASVLLKGSKVDGVYTADPVRDPQARRLPRLTYEEALAGRYAVMDLAAFELCRQAGIAIRIFAMTQPGAIAAALGPDPPGTLIAG